MLLGIVVSVLNTRFLSPENYGDVRYVQNIINFVSSLLLLGYFTSGSRLLAIEDNEEKKRRIRGIMCVILTITVSIVALSMLLMALYTGIRNKPALSELFLIAIPVCGNVLMLSYINTTAQGDNHIARISIARLIPSCLYLLFAFLVFKEFGATPALMLLLYNGIAIITLGCVIISTKPSFRNLKNTFFLLNEENTTYGFNVYLGSLVAVSTQYIAGITLGAFCEDNANVGFYTLALSFSMPMSMLPGIIGTTQFKNFSRVEKISSDVIKYSTVITLITLILFLVFIKYIINFLYSQDYYSVGKYASLLAVGTCFHGFGDMFNRFLGAHGKGKEIRNGAIACGITSILGYLILVYFFKIYGAIATRIASSVVYFLCMIYYYNRYVNNNR